MSSTHVASPDMITGYKEQKRKKTTKDKSILHKHLLTYFVRSLNDNSPSLYQCQTHPLARDGVEEGGNSLQEIIHACIRQLIM